MSRPTAANPRLAALGKSFAAGVVALFCFLAPLSVRAEGGPAPAFRQSGCAAVAKLSRGEIAALLRENTNQMPGVVFAATPSCVAPYAPGALTEETLNLALNRLNALRRLSGLPAAALNPAWCQAAQKGAVVQAANGTLSHQPSRPEDMAADFFRAGAAASASGNLSAGRTLLGAVDALMDDSSAGNIPDLGHRRWQLYPGLTQVGFGYVNNGPHRYRSFVAEKVFDGALSPVTLAYDFVAWPASGFFPNDLSGFTSQSPWSVTLNPDKYQIPQAGDITVTLTRQGDGRTWTFSGGGYSADARPYFSVSHAPYGVSNCIVFAPDGIEQPYEGVYTVEISGLRDAGGAPVTDFAYQVDFFDSQNYVPLGSAVTTFPDVAPADWFAPAVSWAVAEGITDGTGLGFSPGATCTRAQILTFLYRAQGEPTPTRKVNPFRDVDEGDYFYRPAVWAYEMGLVTGDTFAGNTPCTRASAVEYLWILAGRPEAESPAAFPDVSPSDSCAPAVSWAVSAGITQGRNTGFAPGGICTRGEIVTLLHRSHLVAAEKSAKPQL